MSAQQSEPLLADGASEAEIVPSPQYSDSAIFNLLPAPRPSHSKSMSYDSTYDIYHSAPSSPVIQPQEPALPAIVEESSIMTPSNSIPEIQINGSPAPRSQNPSMVDLSTSNSSNDLKSAQVTDSEFTSANAISTAQPYQPTAPTNEKQSRRISHEEYASTLPFTSHTNDSEADLIAEAPSTRTTPRAPTLAYPPVVNNETEIARMGSVHVFPYPATEDASTRPFPPRSSSLMNMHAHYATNTEAELRKSVKDLDGHYSDDMEESEGGEELYGGDKDKGNARERPLPPLPRRERQGIERGVSFIESDQPSRASSRFPVEGGKKMKQEKWGKKQRAIAWVKGRCDIM